MNQDKRKPLARWGGADEQGRKATRWQGETWAHGWKCNCDVCFLDRSIARGRKLARSGAVAEPLTLKKGGATPVIFALKGLALAGVQNAVTVLCFSLAMSLPLMVAAPVTPPLAWETGGKESTGGEPISTEQIAAVARQAIELVAPTVPAPPTGLHVVQ
jgi:hypothetical protein